MKKSDTLIALAAAGSLFAVSCERAPKPVTPEAPATPEATPAPAESSVTPEAAKV